MQLRLLKRLVGLSFLLLTLSLAYHQLAKGAHYFQLSQNNSIKLIRLPAARGLIYDRNGHILAGQRLVLNVAVLAQETKDVKQIFTAISPILGIPQDELLRQFKRNFFASSAPTVVANDIPKHTAIVLESKEADLPGLIIQAEPLRDYRYGRSLSHILGYLGKVTEEELKEFQAYGFQTRDLVGRGGLEETLDQYLRGQPGGLQVEVNNRGHLVQVLGKRQPQNGQELHLTIDAPLQGVVDGLMQEENGTCIVMRPETGAILALVSKPDFDSNWFIDSLNGKSEASLKIEQLLNSRQAPLLNRAISGVYSPGSIFKIVVAAAGLETGQVKVEDSLVCPGSLTVGNRQFLCWELDGHGSENIYASLAHSCNVYFYKLGLALGPGRIAAFARKFGLGSATGIDLPYEASGLVPSQAWKWKTRRERWYAGETANFSIGQGFLLVTPIQIARILAAVGNGGYLVKPHLVKNIGQRQYGIVREKLPLKSETLEIIKQGMRRSVNDPQGTAYRANIPGVQWAAKTGTAQTSLEMPHGWFGAVYPVKKPRIVVVVFLEYGGSGGERPALIAKRIIEYIREFNVDLVTKKASF